MQHGPAVPAANANVTGRLKADPRRAGFELSLRCRCDRGVGAFSIALYINFSPTNVIPHGLGSLVGFLADDDLFLDPRFLTDDCLFLPRLYVDGAVAEGVSGCGAHRTVNGPAFDCHPLLTQGYTLLNGLLDRVDAHAHAALFNYPLTDLELLLIYRDHLFLCSFGAT